MTPKFPIPTHSLYAELKTRVNAQFSGGELTSRGNLQLYSKAFFILTGLIGLYVHLVFFTPAWYIAVPECMLLGLFITATGFNIMHDGSHGSFSTHTWVNTLAAATVECLGGSAYMWRVKHCMLHHSFTNVDEIDDDINIGTLMRLNEHQRKLKMHRFQHLYCWFLYMMFYMTWIFQMDYQRYFTGHIGTVAIPRMNRAEHIKFWSGKLVNAIVFFGIPIYRLGFEWGLIGFVVTAVTAGLCLSVVFQLAHTVEGPGFPVPDASDNILPDEFAIHQIATTANFATHSRLVTWLVGGLNFQIEHHLFPRIAHVHYPRISEVVREVCLERDIDYMEYRTVGKAVSAHFRHLQALGRA